MRRKNKTKLSRQQILRTLRQNRALLEKYSVKKVALFGSYAKDQQGQQSDIDLLVHFTQPTYDNFLGLSDELENLFGRNVEILTPEGLDSIRVRGIAESIRKSLAYA